MNDETINGRSFDITPRPSRDVVPHVSRQLRSLVRHERFSPLPEPFPGWLGYPSPYPLRGLAADAARGQLWLATWGGLLCWSPAEGRCLRHASEHGLMSNAVRQVWVDARGVVWASDERQGLSTLQPDDGGGWTPHEDLRSWTVQCLTGAEDGGVYVALRDAGGQSALGKISPRPDSRLRILTRKGLAVREVEALFVGEQESIWTGNLWGLHRCESDGQVETFDTRGAGVRAIARGIGDSLWLGTWQGLYRFNLAASTLEQEAGWPTEAIVGLATEPDSGDLWVCDIRGAGRLIEGAWVPLQNAPSQLSGLLAVGAVKSRAANSVARTGRIWAIGRASLYDVGSDGYTETLKLDAEDELSNGIECLHVSGGEIFAGTARGLYRFDGASWSKCRMEGSLLDDVRALAEDDGDGQILAATDLGELYSVQASVGTLRDSLGRQVVALTKGADGMVWAATPEAIYLREGEGGAWKLQIDAAHASLGGGVIQSLCYRSTNERAMKASVLYVGTSAGLFLYRRDLGLLEQSEGMKKNLSIQALALDPLTGTIRAGTPAGLFSEADGGQLCEGDVRALAFGAEGHLWVGTTGGLRRLVRAGNGKDFAATPHATFTAADSGLASDIVTALAVRRSGADGEVWIGTAAGLCRYRYQTTDAARD